MLQVSQRESAVLSAAIAVGSMHRHFEHERWPGSMPDDAELQKSISQRQYIKAMRLLRDRLTDPQDPERAEVALVTCFLFICLELIHGDISGAVKHLRSGLRILREQTNSDALSKAPTSVMTRATAFQPVVDQFMALFGRLDYQSTMFGENHPQLLVVPASNTTGAALWIPPSFQSLLEAREYMDTLSSTVFAFRSNIIHDKAIPGGGSADRSKRLRSRWAHAGFKQPSWEDTDGNLPARPNELDSKFGEWKKTLDRFVAKNIQSLSPEDHRDIRVLRILHLVILMLLKECLSTRQMFFDQYLEEFKEIVDLAAALEQSSGLLPSFCIVCWFALLNYTCLL